MNIAVYLKNNLTNIPPSIGQFINLLPFSFRPGIGGIYKRRKEEIERYENSSSEFQKEFIFQRVSSIAKYAYNNTVAYKDYYDSTGFNPVDLQKFSDIHSIPVITKNVLSQYTLDERSTNRKNRYVVNTGGSSGRPFSLYIEPSSMGHEWAHMHTIWENLGYQPSDIKLVFGGRSDVKKHVEYDVLRNHFAIDIYSDYAMVAKQLKSILKKYQIKYLHGYPSSIYDFAMYCNTMDSELKVSLSQNLNGVFLGSEYPHNHYRTAIEQIFKVKTISWYGHTERCILAFEKNERFKYEPFGTYGFSEAIHSQDGALNLTGTSYYNYASPLVRYNTGDVISEIEQTDGILRSFRVTEGREGEFVVDKNSKKINLTGLIFGRHHRLFNYSKFIQVKQDRLGEIEIHFVSETINDASSYFDSQNLNLDIVFVKRSEPHRSPSGKINLLIR